MIRPTIDTKNGTRVFASGWGYGVPLYLAGTRGTVVGRGRKNLQVRFDEELNDEEHGPRSVQPSMLFIVTPLPPTHPLLS